ncbi:TlyA family RNA methyltransferase [Demequina sediminicola]|uniref:TlyA family RNA methyltransferase n=1 Tax=Demequina sediminicola TaxID=1095026 RepID=UPI0007828BEC|nr:TlyA family RNA methyltransferase [Demequina sediminicola]
MRLDRTLHARGLARSRSHAQQLIDAGAVSVDGRTAVKPSLAVSDDALIEVDQEQGHFVSRAAFKLLGALDACQPLGLDVGGAQALDAGASTGGFTQVLLERGVAHVIAVDVGHGQLAPALGDDARVESRERVNVKDLDAGSPGAGVSLVVGDLSFISLTHVIPALVRFAAEDADFVLMVKPQFEVGRGALSSRGVVTDLAKRRQAVLAVAQAMIDVGLTIHHVERSDLPGPQGNEEFFVWASGSWQGRDQEHEMRPMLSGNALKSHIAQEVNGTA